MPLIFKDKTSGKTQTIRIEASSGLKEEDIKKMQQDAELHADEDKKKKLWMLVISCIYN